MAGINVTQICIEFEVLPEPIETPKETTPTKTIKNNDARTYRTIKKCKVKSLRKETRNEVIENKSEQLPIEEVN